jgi:hypothetical protein
MGLEEILSVRLAQQAEILEQERVLLLDGCGQGADAIH